MIAGADGYISGFASALTGEQGTQCRNQRRFSPICPPVWHIQRAL